MQSDLQSVEKVAFSTFARAFAPKMCALGLCRLRMGRYYQEQFPASSGALAGITVSTCSIELNNRILTQLDRRCTGDDSCNWTPEEAGNSSRLILEKNSTHYETRKTISHNSGVKTRANVTKEPFSTDYKFDCIRITLTSFIERSSLCRGSVHIISTFATKYRKNKGVARVGLVARTVSQFSSNRASSRHHGHPTPLIGLDEAITLGWLCSIVRERKFAFLLVGRYVIFLSPLPPFRH